MNQVRAVRPRVFTVSLPRGVNFDDLAEGLLAKRPKDDFERVAHFGFGKYELKTTSEKVAHELVQDPVVKIKDKEYRLNYLGSTLTRVSVFFYPVDEDLTYLRKTLEPFGRISKIEEAKYKKHSFWGSGVWQVFIELHRPIPNFVKITSADRSWVVQCEYQGVTRVCRKCGREGHLNSGCNTPKCIRCGAFGHELCNASCPRCLGDHAVAECRRKTFAAALGYSRGLVPALDVIPDMSELGDGEQNKREGTQSENVVRSDTPPERDTPTEIGRNNHVDSAETGTKSECTTPETNNEMNETNVEGESIDQSGNPPNAGDKHGWEGENLSDNSSAESHPNSERVQQDDASYDRDSCAAETSWRLVELGRVMRVMEPIYSASDGGIPQQHKRKRKKVKKKKPEDMVDKRAKAEDAISFIKACGSQLSLSDSTSSDREEPIERMRTEKKKCQQSKSDDPLEDTDSGATRFYSSSSLESEEPSPPEGSREPRDLKR